VQLKVTECRAERLITRPCTSQLSRISFLPFSVTILEDSVTVLNVRIGFEIFRNCFGNARNRFARKSVTKMRGD
jgi:hypothetical protein